MKQILQNLKDGKTKVLEVPTPPVRPGCVLVKTASSLVSSGTERMVAEFAEKGLMGKARSRPDLVRQVLDKAKREGLISTLEAAFNRLDQPMALGYSSSGTIVETGSGVTQFKVGDRVACGGSGYAVHAEFVVVPENMVTKLPSGVDFDSGAFTTVGAIALHGFRLANPQLKENVAVIGLGLLGLLTINIAQAAGCSVFGVDVNPDRVSLGNQLGAFCVERFLAEENAPAHTHNMGFDAVLICADTASNDPIELAGKICRDRATVVAVGAVNLNIPRKVFYEKEIHFVVSRSYGPGRYDKRYEEEGIDYPAGYVRWTEGRNFQAFTELLAEKKLNLQPLITHRFPIEKGEEAYRLIKNQTGEPYLGVLIHYLHKQTDNPNTKVQITEKIPTIDRKTETIRLGVLGAGNYANATFLPAIQKEKNTLLVGIASASGVNAHHAAKKFNFEYACSDEFNIFSDSTINTVAILTRHHLHASQVIEALQQDKHVFCEKPLAIYEEDLESIYSQIYQKPYCKLTVGFNRRFAPASKEIKSSLEQNQEPIYIHYRINAGFIPSDHWVQNRKIGGGRIIGEVCHFIDLITYFIGEIPAEISAETLPDMEKYHKDNVILTINYPGGSIGTISYLSNGSRILPKEYIEIFSAGNVYILNDFREIEKYKNGKRKKTRFHLKQNKGHRSFWRSFSDSILQGVPLPISYEELWSVTQATFLAEKAVHTRLKYSIPPAPNYKKD